MHLHVRFPSLPFGNLAQLVEQLAVNQWVIGSSPIVPVCLLDTGGFPQLLLLVVIISESTTMAEWVDAYAVRSFGCRKMRRPCRVRIPTRCMEEQIFHELCIY